MGDKERLLGMASLATPMALRVAVTLGLPARLRDEATSVELAGELDVSPMALEMLLAHMATVGVVVRTTTGYRTTAFGTNLCDDDLTTVLMRLDTAGGRAELAFVELLHSVTTGTSAYSHRYGRDFWSDLADHPRLRESFDQQMNYRFRTQIPQLAAGHDWSRYATIVDLGGGRGELLAAILTAHPDVRGHLVDLDPSASEAARRFATEGLADRASVTAASFFDPLPGGADAYLLSDILHNWDDEHAHRILARCVAAAHPGARVLVVEPVGGRHANTTIDLSMLVIFGGRERRMEEFRTLAAPHGLALASATDVSDGRCLLEFQLAG